MAAIKYKGTDGQWHLLNNILVSGINVVQTTGSSSADVMSQSAVTEAINSKQIEVDQTIDSGTSASTNAVSTSAVYGFVTSYTPSITVDQVIDSGTSASTDAVSTSAVYGFVTSYTPSITVDQVLDNTTSASTNPVSSKAVYDAVTDNELVWTNAYVTLSGTVSSHTVNTDIHLTQTEKTNIDSLATNIATISGITSTNVTNWNGASTNSHTHSNKSALNAITGNVGTMAYENANSYSSATQVNTALAGKSDTGHTHEASGVTAMTGYQIAASSASVLTTDSLLQVIGKLEKRIALLETALGGISLVKISQTDYDNLPTPRDSNILYIITD